MEQQKDLNILQINRNQALSSLELTKDTVKKAQQELNKLVAFQTDRDKEYLDAVEQKNNYHTNIWLPAYNFYWRCRSGNRGKDYIRCKEQRQAQYDTAWAGLQNRQKYEASKKEQLEKAKAEVLKARKFLADSITKQSKEQEEFNKIDLQYQNQLTLRNEDLLSKEIEEQKVKVSEKIADAQADPEIAKVSAEIQKQDDKATNDKILIIGGVFVVIVIIFLTFKK